MDDKQVEYEDYWNELQALQKETKNLDEFLDQECKIKEEGEQEADWLRDVGLDHLTDAYFQGREIADSELNASISLLSKHQAEAVKRRVKTLNQTVCNRYQRQQRGRHRKPDIRDVFRDVENSSTGTRSRSATPDSLDSSESEPIAADDGDWTSSREILRPNVTSSSVPKSDSVLPGHELFGRHGHWSMHRVDVASNSEGIELLGYQRFGTVSHAPTWDSRSRSGSVPTVTLSALDLQSTSGADLLRHPSNSSSKVSVQNAHVSRSHGSLWQAGGPTGITDSTLSSVSSQICSKHDKDSVGIGVSFENSFCQTVQKCNVQPRQSFLVGVADNSKLSSHVYELQQVSDSDLRHLKPLLWLELSSIFDKHCVALEKRTPYKRKRKETGNVFGVSLSTLVMRDRRICIDNSTIPQVFQMILGQLGTRCCTEEGILRVAGQKQKVESLCAQIESDFYSRPDDIEKLLKSTTCHELTSILKRLLRELPQPLLTTELIGLFYSCHQLGAWESQHQALNLLVLLLPIEHSGTLSILVSFLEKVVQNQENNKMSLHNAAMIIAPSLFPPRYMQTVLSQLNADLNSQVKMAAVCCCLVEVLLQCGQNLWKIPSSLWLQLQTTSRNLDKPIRKKESLRRSNTHYDSSSRILHGFS